MKSWLFCTIIGAIGYSIAIWTFKSLPCGSLSPGTQQICKTQATKTALSNLGTGGFIGVIGGSIVSLNRQRNRPLFQLNFLLNHKTAIAFLLMLAATAWNHQGAPYNRKTGPLAKPSTNLKIEIALAGQHPNVKAFLAVIRYAEGTKGKNGYRTMYTGVLFSNYARHPNIVNCARTPSGKQLCSSAAGAYQYLTPTWRGVAKALKLKNFSPENQDRGAIYLIKQVGALDDVIKGDFINALTLCSPTWASLPNKQGRSVYAHTGQSAKAINRLLKIYKANRGKIK